MNTAVWIVIAVVVVLLIVALAIAFSRKQRSARRIEAERIREEAAERTVDVEHRQAVADESAAKARRAQADAEAKTAEARRLSLQAQTHRGDAATARDELDSEFARADKIDPDVKRNHRNDASSVDHANNEDRSVAQDSGRHRETHPQVTDGPGVDSHSADPRSTGEKVRDTVDPRRDNDHFRSN